jgi:DNA-binding NtrC family response regulator
VFGPWGLGFCGRLVVLRPWLSRLRSGHYARGVAKVLITGMSGTGKSTVLEVIDAVARQLEDLLRG